MMAHGSDACKRALAAALCLTLPCPAGGYSQAGAAALAAGAGRSLNPALLGKSLPPGAGVHVWLVHPVEPEKPEKKADPGEAEAIIRKILGGKASRRSATTGTPPRRVDVWMSADWAPGVPVEERIRLIGLLRTLWPHGVSVELDAPSFKAPGRSAARGEGGEAALNRTLVARQIGAAVPPGLLGEWGGRRFDGALPFSSRAVPGAPMRGGDAGGIVMGSSARRTVEQAIAEAKRAPRAVPASLRIVEPALRGGEGRSFAHTARWRSVILRYAKRFGVDPALVESLMSAESAGGRYARSRAGAGGLMQLMPATARSLGVRDVYDPEQNIYGGVKYLAGLLKRFGGNPVLAVAAYNSGPGYKSYRRGLIPNIRETVGHVTKVFRRYAQLTGASVDVRRFLSAWGRKVSARLEKTLAPIPTAGAAGATARSVPLPERRPGLLNSMRDAVSAVRSALPFAAPSADPRRGFSVGLPYSGRLKDGVRLEPLGTGYRSIRRERGRLYGTGRLVAGIQWAAERMVAEDPATAPLAVGDLSRQGGGKISHHKSHQNGTDVDLVYYWKDAEGGPVPASDFVNLVPGRPRGYGGRNIYFDTERNWKLVKHLTANPHFKVQWIFTSAAVRDDLLRYAGKSGESASVIKAASAALNVEANHANHFHVRIR